MGRRLDALTFGPQRRTRHMMRQLAKLDRHDAALRAAGRDPMDDWYRTRDMRREPDRPARPPRSSRLRTPLVLAVVAAAVAALLFGYHDYYHRDGAPGVVAGGRSPAVPPPGVGEQRDRLGVPAPAPAGAGGYRFEHTRADAATPVTWDPCRAIHFVTTGTAPRGWARVVPSVLAQVTRLTGFRFVDDGPTDEVPTTNRPGYQPDRYRGRWAPVLVAWTSDRTVAKLAGHTIGLGGGYSIGSDTIARTYVSGIVYLDKPQFVSDLAHVHGTERARVSAMLRGVVRHEVGHLLGLAHVADRRSIMFPESRLAVTDYSAGDRRGLHALSEGSCEPEL